MITVFGSLNVDYVFQVAQLPAPGETVLATNMEVLPGGKGGNQALAAAKAGAKVHMVGAVGKDGLGDIAMAGLMAAGVNTSAVTQSLKPTGTAAINVDAAGENAITVSAGANLEATGESLDASQLNPQTTLLLQMEVSMSAMTDLIQQCRAVVANIVWNLAPMQSIELPVLQQVDYLVVNEGELAQLHADLLNGSDSGDSASTGAEQQAQDVVALTGQSIVVTLGADGTLAVHENSVLRVPALPISPIDTVGAGDAFTGAFTAALDAGETFHQAMRWGSVAGGLACLETGAQSALPTRAQILERLRELPTG
jgi:ribokinase